MVEHKRVGGVQEVAGEEIVSIEHIPPNDWAAVGARHLWPHGRGESCFDEQ